MNPGNPARCKERKMFRNMKKHAGKVAAVGTAAATLAGGAFAAATPIDITSVLDQITVGQVAGVAVCIAFGVAVWAIRSGKLLRRG